MSKDQNLKMNNGESNWFYYPIQFIDKSNQSAQKQTVKPLPIFDEKDDPVLIFTHRSEIGSRSLFKQIHTLVNEAVVKNEFVLLSSFLVNNSDMIVLLIDAAKKLPGKVYVLIGLDQPIYGSFNRNGEYEERGLVELANAGVLIRKAKGAHLKFLVAGESAVIMTTNLTTEGLFRNPEFGLIFRKNHEVITALKRIFSLLWHARSENILHNNQWLPSANWNVVETLNSAQLQAVPELILSSEILINEINRQFQVLNSSILFHSICEALKRAQNYIKISVFAFELDLDSDIIEILKNKAKNGISVFILVPELRTRFSKFMSKTLLDLKKNGVKIRYYQELHGKMLLVDGKSVLVFSGNFDKYLKNPDSFDMGFKSEHGALVQNCNKLFDHLWEEAASECGVKAPLRLNLDLAIKSADHFSDFYPFPITKLKEIITHCEKIFFYFSEKNSILEIHQLDFKPLIFRLDNRNVEFENDVMNISALFTTITPLNKKNAEVFQIDSLNLRLFWEKTEL